MDFKRVETLREYKLTWGEKGLRRRRGLTSQYSRGNVVGTFSPVLIQENEMSREGRDLGLMNAKVKLHCF